MELSIYESRPEKMNLYLSYNGWHFSERMCELAVYRMQKLNKATGHKERIEGIKKDKVDELLAKYNIKLEKNELYDYVYVANMGMADVYKSSVPDEAHLAQYVKDIIDDPDAPEGLVMRQWYVKMIALNKPIDWGDML